MKVFSRSLDKWFDGKVLGLLSADDPETGGVKGDVKVTYGDGITKCVDPTDRQSLIEAVVQEKHDDILAEHQTNIMRLTEKACF